MNNKEFARILEERTRIFAIKIIKFSSSLKKTPENMVLKNQITKSGTSIGANYVEANRARSKRDFTNKINICESEASETVYWLKIIIDTNNLHCIQSKETLQEANEILAIFSSIGKSLKL